jgi:hypothetical protein
MVLDHLHLNMSKDQELSTLPCLHPNMLPLHRSPWWCDFWYVTPTNCVYHIINPKDTLSCNCKSTPIVLDRFSSYYESTTV